MRQLIIKDRSVVRPIIVKVCLASSFCKEKNSTLSSGRPHAMNVVRHDRPHRNGEEQPSDWRAGSAIAFSGGLPFLRIHHPFLPKSCRETPACLQLLE